MIAAQITMSVTPNAEMMGSYLGAFVGSYALAVILFQLLNRGTHPFQGIITDPDITCSTNDEKAALGLYSYGTIRNFQIKPRPQSTHLI